LKRKIILFALFYSLLFFAACKKKQNPAVVSTKIPETELVSILTDVHLAESMINATIEINKRDSLAQALYSKIYIMHKVTAADVNASINTYLHAPLAARGLYEKIAARLSLLDSEFQAQATNQQTPLVNPINQNQLPLPSAK
jgi:hypothetical protein